MAKKTTTEATPATTTTATIRCKIIAISGDGSKEKQEPNAVFMKTDKQFEHFDENGSVEMTDTFSKGVKSLIEMLSSSVDCIEMLSMLCVGTPHLYDNCVSLVMLALNGADVTITREIMGKGDVINGITLEKPTYVTTDIKVNNADDLNEAFWSTRGQRKFTMLSARIKKNADVLDF